MEQIPWIKEGFSDRSILAGPILRRAEPHRVFIWLATNADVIIRGEIIDAKLARDDAPAIYGKKDLLGEGEAASVRLGENLYITLVEVRPVERRGEKRRLFPLDRLLAYNLILRPRVTRNEDPERGSRLPPLRLKFFFPKGKIEDPVNGIAYPGLKLPTFYLPSGDPTKSKPNILHGSCRKLHGEGGDALGFADYLIGKNAGIPDKAGNSRQLWRRPNALFLTGDQIYADTVSELLIGHLVTLSEDLMGKPEFVPTRTGAIKERRPDMVKRWFDLSKLLLTAEAKELRYHLLAFGEYAAMYLLTWNPALWPEEWPRSLAKKKPKEYEIIKAAQAEVPRIRRALANVPTYMIFDDHDVTDDWNFNEKWVTRIESSELGRRLVTNALAAYWAFQSWGNDPDKFDELRAPISQHIAGQRDDAGGDFLERTLMDKRRLWSFTAPTLPEAIFLDTRTHREFERERGQAVGQGTKAPRLLNKDALAQFKATANEVLGRSKDKILLIVTPSPIFNIKYTEENLSMFGRWPSLVSVISWELRVRSLSREWADLELWLDNPAGYIDMVLALAEIKSEICIILSGDVHYAFAQVAFLLRKGAFASAPFLQLTGSALQNMHTELSEWIIDHTRNKEEVEKFVELSVDNSTARYVKKTDKPDLLVRVNLLGKQRASSATGPDQLGRPPFEKMIVKESNIAQLEINGDEVRNTFHIRRLDQRRTPGVAPVPDSPVVVYSWKK